MHPYTKYNKLSQFTKSSLLSSLLIIYLSTCNTSVSNTNPNLFNINNIEGYIKNELNNFLHKNSNAQI